MHQLSKTDYILYRECKKNVWLKINKPEVYYNKELSAFEQSIIDTGNEVELKARELFPTGILIEGRGEQAQKETMNLIGRGETSAIFQPVFSKDGIFAALDILKYDEESKSYYIYEIKASNSVKDKIHVYDLAFQVVLLKKVGLKIGKAHILHLNSEYVRSGGLDIIKLFSIDDVTERINEKIEQVEEEMEQALKYVNEKKEPSSPCECIYKGRSNHCTTFSYSNPQVPDYSVHDIARIGMGKGKLTELIDGNIYYVHEVPEQTKLSDIQTNQVNTAITKRPIIKLDKIKDELSQLSFPLYFIDYETFPCAVPRFDGFSPYQQIPFQYSLYILNSLDDMNDDKIIHKEFLYTENTDPTKPFADSLQKDIGPKGSVIVWNKKFECKINEELVERIPNIRNFVLNMNSRTYDLMDIFSKQYYVHHAFMGSTSIKYVLPVLVPELSYKDLDIKEGGTASQKWNEIVTGNIPKVEQKEIAKNLLEYCKLDTYAMYAIFRALNKEI